ncbi:MAG: 30S ribosomal protein S6 [Ignavibacteria bacterium]|nr:30S ribosomal protein S6 [Ignavibacteria bacterium]MBI3766114.1 30S ribosomal protein S6 [Ignavibacteriales bacterium]
MDQSKRLYETTFIINASLEDTQIETAITHISETITRNGGEITSTNKWGRKRLAYPIQKKNNGFYANMEFVAPGTVVAQLERVYTLDENILRFLTIQLDGKAVMARQQAITKTAASSPPEAPTKEPLFDSDQDVSQSKR